MNLGSFLAVHIDIDGYNYNVYLFDRADVDPKRQKNTKSNKTTYIYDSATRLIAPFAIKGPYQAQP